MLAGDICLDIVDHGNGILAAQHILAAVIQPDKKTRAPAAVIAEIGADHDVAEIAPVTETSSATAKPYSTGGWITGVD